MIDVHTPLYHPVLESCVWLWGQRSVSCMEGEVNKSLDVVLSWQKAQAWEAWAITFAELSNWRHD